MLKQFYHPIRVSLVTLQASLSVPTFLVLTLLVPVQVSAEIAPRSRQVDLVEFTEMTVFVMPDLSARLIFPFAFDTVPENQQLSVDWTRQDVFTVDGKTQANSNAKVDLVAEPGKNSLIISIKKADDKNGNTIDFVKNTYLGMLNIQVKGYHMSVMLKTTVNADNYYSNVIFNETEKKRLYLFENALADLREKQEALFNEKMAKLDEEAERQALVKLGTVAIQEVEDIPIRYEQQIPLGRHGDVTVYLDKLFDYKRFIVMRWILENTSNTDLMINDIQLSMTTPTTSSVLIPVVFDCRENIKAGSEQVCSMTTQSRDMINMDNGDYNFALTINTNRGILPVKLEK